MKNLLKNMTASDKAFYGTIGALGTVTGTARYLADKNYPIEGIFESIVLTKIDTLIEEASSGGILQELDKLLKDKWDWKLTPEIKEKFESRFSNIKKDPKGYIAYDNKKKRPVYLRPDNKSFVLVKDTGNWCGFLRGAVGASKNKAKA